MRGRYSALSLLASLAIHGTAVFIIVSAGWWTSRHTEINPIVFQMVDEADLEIGDHFEMPGPPSPAPGVKYHRSNVKLLPVPKNSPPPEPEAAKPENSRAPTKAPTKIPAKGTTSYEQFRKQNQRQIEQNQKISSARRSSTAPGIDTKGIMDDLQRYARGPRGDGGGTGGTRMMVAALDAYFARLIRALRAAHEMPESVNELLVARVSFFLASDGSISAVRILKSSGDPAYDDSVIEAFQHVRSIGAVPGGKSGTFEINFKMTE